MSTNNFIFCYQRTRLGHVQANGHVNGSSGIKQTPISGAAINRCAPHQRHAFVRPGNIHGGVQAKEAQGGSFCFLRLSSQSIKTCGVLDGHSVTADSPGTHSRKRTVFGFVFELHRKEWHTGWILLAAVSLIWCRFTPDITGLLHAWIWTTTTITHRTPAEVSGYTVLLRVCV